MAYFKDWIFNQLPRYHQKTDNYKDAQGNGLLKRYLRSVGDELDEEFIPYMENFIDLIDFMTCDDKYLPLIGGILGYPPSIDGLNSTYRKILAYAVVVYKIKGTFKSYQIVFNLLGINITIEEIMPKKKITYDLPVPKYDADPTYIYDSECDRCGIYNLKYKFQAGFGPMTSTILGYIQNIICWLEPINATLGTITEDTGESGRIILEDGENPGDILTEILDNIIIE